MFEYICLAVIGVMASVTAFNGVFSGSEPWRCILLGIIGAAFIGGALYLYNESKGETK